MIRPVHVGDHVVVKQSPFAFLNGRTGRITWSYGGDWYDITMRYAAGPGGQRTRFYVVEGCFLTVLAGRRPKSRPPRRLSKV